MKETKDEEHSTVQDAAPARRISRFIDIGNKLLHSWGVETHGIQPIPVENRLDGRMHQMFWLWFSCNFNILAFGSSAAGPLFYGLGMKESLVTMLVVNTIVCIIPAYFAIFGPKLGMRAMVQGRYSFGLYFATIPSILNVFSLQGWNIITCIIGGQTLAASSDKLNDSLGIVIVAVASLLVSFCGYQVMHWYESVAWIPNVFIFITLLVCGWKNLAVLPTPPPTAAAVISFGTFLFAGTLSWATMTSDLGIHHDAKRASFVTFIYAYAGLWLSINAACMLGIVFAASAPAIPSWKAGLGKGSNIGGLVSAVLEPSGVFGKILLVFAALSTLSSSAPAMYSFCTSFMAISAVFAKIPRYMFSVVSTVILIPLSLVGAQRFYSTYADVLSIIGYWTAAFTAIVLCEHLVFRKRNYDNYDLDAWNIAKRLPVGLAALFSFIGAFGVMIPSLSQAFYTGPIARLGTGDIGVLTGFVAAGFLYLPLRSVERKMWPLR